MPIYEFQCTNAECKNREEHFLRHSDPLPTVCEKCTSPIEKLVSQTSFALKGSGWYVTDYKSNGSGTSGSSTNGSESASSGDPSASGASTKESALVSDSDSGNAPQPSKDSSCSAPACATSGCASV